jgi:hypothetical protein
MVPTLRLALLACAAALALLVPAGAATAAPPLPGHWERGFTFTAYSSWAYDQATAAQSMDRLKATGANAVAIYTTWYQDSPSATTIYADGSRTPSESGVVARIRQAKALGLQVMLRPHVSSKSGAEWRGQFQPSDRNAWFASYRNMIAHFADLARREGVASLEIGSEMTTLSGEAAQWRQVVATARARFSGRLLYAANHDEFERVSWWDAVDQIGVDAYWSLSCPSSTTPSVESLVAAWRPILDRVGAVAARFGKPVVFPEAGYRNIEGSTCNPWDYGRWAPQDDAGQQRALTAMFQAVQERSWFRGIYLWRWHWSTADIGPTDFSVAGKPAESTVRQWYTTSSTTPPPPPPPPAGSGLKGEYYDFMNWTGLKMTRTDARIDFTWGTGTPNAALGSEEFAVRWTGTVTPRYSEVHRFYTSSDDGVRVWVDGVLRIDRWVRQGTTTYTADVSLTAGRAHTIRVEYFEAGGAANMRLEWSGARTPRQVVPAEVLRPAA